MKKRILALLFLLSLLLTACASPAQPTTPGVCAAHTDADDNGVCDVCLSYVLVVVDFYNINDLHGKIDDTDRQPGVDELTTYFKRMQRSDGTADQLYLALRLAVAEELTPEAPLVLDDALVRFDDDRMALAMGILKEAARDKQVILFTCQNRETKHL